MKPLTLNEYQKLAARTAGAGGDGDHRLIISALGLAGEAGSAIEIAPSASFRSLGPAGFDRLF